MAIVSDAQRIAVLTGMVTDLADSLREAHQDEVNHQHHGDGAKGCSYCAVLKDAKRVLAGKERVEHA